MRAITGDGTYSGSGLLYSTSSGSLYGLRNGTAYTYSSSCYGTRPVVVLKAGILTSESKDEQFLGQTCWTVYESE